MDRGEYKGGTQMKTLNALLGELTFDNLDHWAGAKIRARGKTYISRVDGLHRTARGELVAWVSGTEDYATLVHLDEMGDHQWFCTCPYDGGPCKHAVAVILAAARQVKQKHDIPLLGEDDDLALVLFGEEDAVPCEEHGPEVEPLATPEPMGKTGSSKIRKLLAAKSREELLELFVTLAVEYPAVERALLETEQCKSGRIEPLVRSLRREINSLTGEPAWSSHWSGERDIPDYSHVRRQFAALLAAGHADALLELGDELWRQGSEQVEQSDDDGETGEAIAQCLDIVLRALPRSSLPQAEQLLWVIDRLLEDEFGLLHAGEKVLEDEAYGPEAWRHVAALLEERLNGKGTPRSSTPSGLFRRTALQERLIAAYRRSGWPEKIVPLMEQEVDQLGNYGQLVDVLLEAGDWDQARRWSRHGFARTIKEAPGKAEGLQERLRRIAEIQRQYDLVTAHRAQEFFRRPSLERYKELRKAAEKLGCWPIVRAGVLGYLESGRRPDVPTKKEGEPKGWPLPEPEVWYPQEKPKSGIRDSFPDRSALIDIAIFEKRFDDVVSLYQAMRKGSAGFGEIDQTVAKAVAQTRPEVALSIWRHFVDGLIAQVKPRAYVEAGGFLRLMRKVFEANQRLTEWEGLLAELRRTHKAKRRLLEVLDSLSDGGKKIIG
jgi:uncharacterized Zn finger protein